MGDQFKNDCENMKYILQHLNSIIINNHFKALSINSMKSNSNNPKENIQTNKIDNIWFLLRVCIFKTDQ